MCLISRDELDSILENFPSKVMDLKEDVEEGTEEEKEEDEEEGRERDDDVSERG